jgi:hypothetical protein
MLARVAKKNVNTFVKLMSEIHKQNWTALLLEKTLDDTSLRE